MADPGTKRDGGPPDAAAIDPAEVLLRWRSHPVRERHERLVLVVAILLGLPAILLALYGPFFAVLAFVILGASLGSFFLPTDYVLYRGGGEMRFLWITRRFTWAQYRSFYPDRNGVLLSPFTRPSRLENFRGIYLRFGRRADEIMAVVTEQLAARTEALDANGGVTS
ncbi:MAG TPA: hypothetical protein VM118_07355 [Acidobacteriota bacterium]|nr:hypothetical protein [Acidobacteriota bacterium]